jgi:putative glutamine amidotransferase
LIQWALEDRKPILAVCRGLQIMNVALGGSLYQDVKNQIPAAAKHDYFPTKDNPARDYLAHPIEVEPHTRLAELLGDSSVPVNSMHHQAIKKLGGGLVPSAFSPDGLIEGIERAGDQYMVAVQWHPEELAARDAGMNRLFSSFIDAAA